MDTLAGARPKSLSRQPGREAAKTARIDHEPAGDGAHWFEDFDAEGNSRGHAIAEERPDHTWVKMMTVNPHERGKGVGSGLLDHIQRHFGKPLRLKPYPIGEREGDPGEEDLRGWYGRRGFTDYQRQEGDDPEAHEWMERHGAREILRNPHTNGREWYHGTRASSAQLAGGFRISDEDPDPDWPPHWSTGLGVHFAAHHSMADRFADPAVGVGGRGMAADPEHSQTPSVVHARLHVQNPKVYDNEDRMADDVFEHEHGERKNYISNYLKADDERVPYAAGTYFSYDHHPDEAPARGEYEHFDDWEDHAEWGEERPAPVYRREQWLNLHPDAAGIARRHRERLQAQGHDGIVYGNSAPDEQVRSRKPESNMAAIAFHPSQIEITKHHVHGDEHKTAAARWSPSSGVFGPTTGHDPILFDGDELRPEVRRDVMERLDQALRVDTGLVGSDWQDWTKVYLAGGSASEWAGARPNDAAEDLDILIGVNYFEARRGSGAFQDMDSSQIDTAFNSALRAAFNDPDWHPAFGGTWQLTGYVNPDAYDITRIKPYAAYNITDMTWAVHPPHLPEHTLADFDPAILAYARAVAHQVRAILKLPEPLRTREARALWEALHADRRAAFSDQGEGWQDAGNLVEKYLSYHPDRLLDKLRKIVFADPGNLSPGNINNRGDKDLHPLQAGEAQGQEALRVGASRAEGGEGLFPGSLQEVSKRGAGRPREAVQDRPHSAGMRDLREARHTSGVQGQELLSALPGGSSGGGAGEVPGEARGSFPVSAQHLFEEDLRHHHRGVRGDAGGAGRQVRDLPGDGGGLGPAQLLRGSQPRDRQAAEAVVRELQFPGQESGGRPGSVRADGGLHQGAPGAGRLASRLPGQVVMMHPRDLMQYVERYRTEDPGGVRHRQDLAEQIQRHGYDPERHGGMSGDKHYHPISSPIELVHDDNASYFMEGNHRVHALNDIGYDKPVPVLVKDLRTQQRTAAVEPYDENGEPRPWHRRWPGESKEDATARRGQYIQQVADRHGVSPAAAHKAIARVAGDLDEDLAFTDGRKYGFANNPGHHEIFSENQIKHLMTPEIWHGVPVTHISTEGLHASQNWLRPRTLAHNLFHPGKKPGQVDDEEGHPDFDPDDLPREEDDYDDIDEGSRPRPDLGQHTRFLRRDNGTMMVVDGHHRAAIDMALGKETTPGTIIDESRLRAAMGPPRVHLHGEEMSAADLHAHMLQHHDRTRSELPEPRDANHLDLVDEHDHSHEFEDPGHEHQLPESAREKGRIPARVIDKYAAAGPAEEWPIEEVGKLKSADYTVYYSPATKSTYAPDVEETYRRSGRSLLADPGYHQKLRQSISEEGIKTPLEVKGGTLLNGHNRYWIARDKGLATVPVRRVKRASDQEPESAWWKPKTAAADSIYIPSALPEEALERAKTHPHQVAASYAQYHARMNHPRVTMRFPRSHEGGDELVGSILRHTGYEGDTEGAFVARHPDPSRMTSNPSWLGGKPGVALHPDSWDYGTVAHEAAHHALMYHHAIGPNEHQPDEQIHGPEWAGYYARGLNYISPGAGDDFLHHRQHYLEEIEARQGHAKTASSDGDDWVTCERGCEHWGKHGAAGLLIRHRGEDGLYRYLLQKRSDDGDEIDHPGVWSIPSGAIGKGETPEEGAKREYREEHGPLPQGVTHHHTVKSTDHGDWAFHTVVMDSPERFEPRGGGETGFEQQGAAWHTAAEVRGMKNRGELHPAFAESWDKVRQSRPTVAQATETQATADYRQADSQQRRCGNCVMFRKGKKHDWCTKVKGSIEESGVCRFFYAKPNSHRSHLWNQDRSKTAVTGYDVAPRSGMIYLDVPPELIHKVPGGVDDHHITVVYLGKGLSDEQFEKACQRAQEAASKIHPLQGTLEGTETFPPSESSEGKTPAFVPARVPGLDALRGELEDLSASEHGFRPHVTLAYLEDGDEVPPPHPATPVRFTHLHVKRGDDVKSFPLGGDLAKEADYRQPPTEETWEARRQRVSKWLDKQGETFHLPSKWGPHTSNQVAHALIAEYDGPERDEHWEHLPDQEVSLRQPVHTHQGFVYTDTVKHYLNADADPDQYYESGEYTPGGDEPKFVKHEGTHYMLDGHHRYAKDRLMGHESMYGKVFDTANPEHKQANCYECHQDEAEQDYDHDSADCPTCKQHGWHV